MDILYSTKKVNLGSKMDTRKFLPSLNLEKAFLSGHATKPNTTDRLVLFEWEDTLFPTSYSNKVTEFERSVIDRVLHDLLALCLTKAKVAIVTFAKKCVIDANLHHLPSTQKLMHKVTVVYAQDYLFRLGCCPKFNADSFTLAKQFGYESAISHHRGIQEIICVSDSKSDIDAGLNVSKRREIKCRNIQVDPFVASNSFGLKIDKLKRELSCIFENKVMIPLPCVPQSPTTQRTRRSFLTTRRHFTQR